MPTQDHNPIPHLLAAARRSVEYGKRLLSGIEPAAFARLPRVGMLAANADAASRAAALACPAVQTNHPAFVYGHLSLYPAIVLRTCSIAGSVLPALPAWQSSNGGDYASLFGRGAPCVDDPAGTIYPPMHTIVRAYAEGFDAVFAALETLPPEALSRPNADSARSATFTTVGFALFFLLSNHTATHLGQVSAWRRIAGLGPA